SGSVTRKLNPGPAGKDGAKPAAKTVEGIEIISVSGGSVSRVVADNDGMPLVATLQGGFTLEVTDAIAKDFKAEPVSIQSAMEAKPAVKDQFKLKRMDVTIAFEHDDGDGVEQLADSNEYHDVLKYADEKGSGYGLRLKAQKLPADFQAPALPLADVPEDVRRYMKPTSICQSDDADLMKEAARLTKGVTDSRKAAEAICAWVYRYLGKESGATGGASARQAYDEKKGDCTEHSALFVAVARAAGLPARNIGGIVYLASGDSAFFGYHAWSEVWLGRWVPVDATVNEVGTSARYILFTVDEPGDTHGSGRISRCIGQKIKPQVDAYELTTGASWKRKGARELKFTQE
ncbi:MAG: transglutaminase-like domain-containing protein, partial [Planctomycetes bacterium]|nr:transglutaminase-like domain-containing protein [Planctomycetota bacterium]